MDSIPTSRTRTYLGSLRLTTKNYRAAQAAFERAIELNPEQMTAFLRLGKVYQDQGQTAVAIARYEKALQLQPKQVPLHVLVGNLYLDQGDLGTARRYYEQALALDPDFGVAAGNLAWVYVQQGENLDVALGLAQKARQRHPDVVPIADTLGWILYKKGLNDIALRLLKECVEKMPDSPHYHYHLGKALAAVGDSAQARVQFETALRLKLGGADAADATRALGSMQ